MPDDGGARAAGRSRRIGVFDSGLGGLTVVKALRERLPNERIVYLGDTARVPYGTRSGHTVLRYARGCSAVLVERDIKLLVIACNTVSAVAVDMLRAELDLPVVGVVEPGASAAVAAAQELTADAGPVRIGVLGTRGTVASGAYPRAVAQCSTRFEVVTQPAPLLVPLVEEGWLDGTVPELVVRQYVEPLVSAGARVLVLGCTHYPLLFELIRRVATELAGRPVYVVDGAVATATDVERILVEASLENPEADGELELLVTDQPAQFEQTASRFLGTALPAVQQIDL